ncbi:MAG TPA: hypothetical protein VOB72_13455 [Candidatus Dormibacteraeota bacterium]|nr:hypothetical protein [Candidatus Dormibacteraeota bacterium]
MEVRGSPRARRAIALIAVSLCVLAAGVGLYLWSNAPHPYSGPPPPATSRPIPVSMDWRSASMGWVIVHDSGSPASFLFRTLDGGVHWERQLSVDGPASVRFSDARHGIVQVGAVRAAGVTALRTDDGGAHWRPVAQPDVEPGTVISVLQLAGDSGWALSRTAPYRTDDAGAHWERVLGPWAVAGDDLLDVSFAAGGTAWLAGAALFMTRDNGEAWTRESLPVARPGPAAADRLEIRAPTVSSDGRGVLPVYDRDADQTWLFVSADGGATWRDPVPLAGGGGSRRPAFVDGSAGWTAGPDAAWSTTDGGRTWRPAAALDAGWQFESVTPVSAAMAWVNAVQVRDQSVGGPASWGLFRTSDAGQHWTRVALPDLS